jgi:MFS transporter, UMF1 family
MLLPGPDGDSYSAEECEHRTIGVGLSGAKLSSPELSLSTQISSKGVGIGYCAAVLVQLFSVLVQYSSPFLR